MAEKLTTEQKKEHAKLLYTREGVSVQKDLAARVGVSEKTIGKWIKEEGWKQQKASLIMTKEEELVRLYEQLTELNDTIKNRPKGQRFGSSKEADTLVKITAAIKSLETNVSVAEAMQTLKSLINLVSTENLTEAKLITKWADIYIKSLLR